MVTPTGPFLKGACFCEKVLREADGVLSAIRVVDRLHISATGPSAPEAMPESPYQMNALIMFTSGTARGSQELKIQLEEPSGLTKEPYIRTVFFEGEEKGVNLIIGIRTVFKEAGLYWYNVYLDAKLITKMPFRVIYGRTSGGATPPPN